MKDLYRNTLYAYTESKKGWAFVDEIDGDNIDCTSYDDPEHHFTAQAYEFRTWLEDDIIRPVCGVCLQPVVTLDQHLKVFHMVKMHG